MEAKESKSGTANKLPTDAQLENSKEPEFEASEVENLDQETKIDRQKNVGLFS
jgi:hypothetical protein